jgi:hypothetical protein
MTRKQFGTTSTSPSGARSHMSSKGDDGFAQEFLQAGPGGSRLANTKPR